MSTDKDRSSPAPKDHSKSEESRNQSFETRKRNYGLLY